MNAHPEFTQAITLAGSDMATQLADLLTYGLVGLAEPVIASALPEGATWWTADTSGDAPTFGQISPQLRAVVIDRGAPVADRRLLGAMITMKGQTDTPQDNVIYLPPPESVTDLTKHLTRRAAKEVASRAMMLREYRRQQLGLSAKLPAAQTDAAIYDAFVVPAAQAAIAQVSNGHQQVRISATPPPAQRDIRHFVPLCPQADDPLSENVFALAMRTGFHGTTSVAMKPWVHLSPFHFGLQVRRAKAPSEMMHRIALSTPQLCLLSTRTVKGS